AVFVFVNASEEERVIPMEHYAEITTRYQPQGKEILTGTTVDMTQPRTIAPLSAVIVKLLPR
ncbi:MAG: cyclomaltodextrinase C-terminal domain-containing protein, partial [Paludibacteraceae bacterium]